MPKNKTVCVIEHQGLGLLRVTTDSAFYTSQVDLHVRHLRSIDELRSAAGVKIGTRLWFVTGDYLDTVARPARVRKALDAAREGWRNEQALRVQGNGKG